MNGRVGLKNLSPVLNVNQEIGIKKKMKNESWKIIAITFIILFGLLLLYNIWAIDSAFDEIEKTNECFYNICKEYFYADYVDGICSCYSDELIVEKIEYIKDLP